MTRAVDEDPGQIENVSRSRPLFIVLLSSKDSGSAKVTEQNNTTNTKSICSEIIPGVPAPVDCMPVSTRGLSPCYLSYLQEEKSVHPSIQPSISSSHLTPSPTTRGNYSHDIRESLTHSLGCFVISNRSFPSDMPWHNIPSRFFAHVTQKIPSKTPKKHKQIPPACFP